MAVRNVSSHATVAAPADAVWASVRDFCAPWHPLVETMQAQPTGQGGLIRRFTVRGENTVYKERLTFFSDSDRVMAYTHVAGIDGVQSYSARLTVTPAGTGAVVSMTAEVRAPAARCDDIATGTQAIFDIGTRAIADLVQGAQNAPAPEAAPEPHAPRLQKVEIDDLPRLTLTATEGDGDTLCLLLHGIGGHRSNWDAQLAAIAPFCRAAAMDLRGYGDSSLGAAQSTVDDYCADILRAMQVLGARRLILGGLSYGAWIATSFAMRHRDRLAGLILSGGCTGMSEAGPDEREAFRLSREVPMREGRTPADFAPAVVDIIAGPDAGAAIRDTLRHSMSAIPAQTYADALRCFTNPLERFDFSRLNLPVLLITGEHDRLAPPAEIRRVADRIWDAAKDPDVRYETLAGAGHVCNLENPDRYNRILSEYLPRVLA